VWESVAERVLPTTLSEVVCASVDLFGVILCCSASFRVVWRGFVSGLLTGVCANVCVMSYWQTWRTQLLGHVANTTVCLSITVLLRVFVRSLCLPSPLFSHRKGLRCLLFLRTTTNHSCELLSTAQFTTHASDTETHKSATRYTAFPRVPSFRVCLIG